MDYFFLQTLVVQLQSQLQGSLLNKVYQPDRDLLILKLWNGRIEQRLLIGVGGVGPRIYLTTDNHRNPMRPPRFCQLLRARLKRLVRIEMDPADRIVRLRFVGPEDESYTLIAELFGREGNVILIDHHHNVVDSLFRTKLGCTRPFVVGRPYISPDIRDGMHLTRSSEFIAPEGDVTEWPNLSLQAEQHFDEVAATLQRKHGVDEHTELRKAVSTALKRLSKRLNHIDQQIDQCLNCEEEKQSGDLLLANLHVMKRGMEEIEVLDYYQDPPIMTTLALLPAKTPQENAELYFKRYRKGKRGLDHCQRRLQQTQMETEWLEQISQQLDDQVTSADSDMIREELVESGWYKPATALQRDTRHQKPAKLVNRTQSPNGWEIVWGRNNKTNDYVSKTLLKPRDLWFHAHKIPGCHLIIKSDGAEVPMEDQLFAASLCAAHSRAANDSRVEVMVTEGKHVKRIKGAPSGLVRVETYRVLQVVPTNK